MFSKRSNKRVNSMQSGLMALTSVLIVSALILLVSVGIVTTSLGEAEIGRGALLSRQSLSVAESCTRIALHEVMREGVFDSKEMDDVIDGHSCTIEVVDHEEGMKRLGGSATVEGYQKRMEVEVHDVLEGIIGWWRFDESDGEIAFDSSYHDHHGEIEGDPEWVEDREEKDYRALEFDGEGEEGQSEEGDYVEVESDLYQFGDDDSFTIVLWARMFDNNRFLCAYRYHLQRSTFRTRGDDELSVDTGIEDDDWYHIAIAYDGSEEMKQLIGFVDGEEVDADSIEGSPLSTYNSKDLRVGMTTHSAGVWSNVVVDDLRIYDRVLSEEEVEIIMESSRRWIER